MCQFWMVFLMGLCIRTSKATNYFCANMNPQQHINIEQLMGMWYGIEILTHTVEERHYNIVVPSCPIIHISEDRSHPTTHSPLHRDYDYGYNYGEKRTDFPTTHEEYPKGGKRTYERRYGTTELRSGLRPEPMKRLRIWWDESGSGTEYLLRYNVSRPGFWISQGPQNGSEIEAQFSSFAGTVQVMKAVGNHLVLNFCHQLPERQLFTVILSREHKLDATDIHGVHSLLNRRGLGTNAIKKVCSGGTAGFRFYSSVVLILILNRLLSRI